MAIINEELAKGMVAQTEASMRGEVVFIKNTLDRVGKTFNYMQSRMTLVGGNSGTGKSAFVDDTMILKVWRQVKDNPDIHWEVLYYSMERKKMFKHAKWMSWFMYTDFKSYLSADAYLGWHPGGHINSVIKERYDSLLEEMSELLDAVDIFDGRTSVPKIAKMVVRKARQLGVLYKADDIGILIDDDPSYKYLFNTKDVQQTRHGKVPFIHFEYKGIQYTLNPGKHVYIPHHKHTFLTIVLDGIGLIDTKGYKSTKEAIDAVVNLLSDARDFYGFSPVIVSQFNRAISDIHRQKHHGSGNEPQESDFKDSSNQYQAADVVIGLFDPVRSKATDGDFYRGFDVLEGMKSKGGAYRFRSIKILKNSFGIDNVTYGLKFLGEVNHFETLPVPTGPSDAELEVWRLKMDEIYSEIHTGK